MIKIKFFFVLFLVGWIDCNVVADEIKLGDFPRGKWLDTTWQAYWTFGEDSICLLDVHDKEIYNFTGIVQNMVVEKLTTGYRLTFDCAQARRSYQFETLMGSKALKMAIRQVGKSIAYTMDMPTVSEKQLSDYKVAVIAEKPADLAKVVAAIEMVDPSIQSAKESALAAQQIPIILQLAAVADFIQLEKVVSETGTTHVIDSLVQNLEALSAKPDAPPSVFIALSVLYGRKGLRSKEYAALELAEKAPPPPGINFNVTLFYGRKQLLAGAPDAELFMVGSLELTSFPIGSVVYIDGVKKGVTPLFAEKIKAGTHTLQLEYDGYQNGFAELEIGVGATVSKSLQLKPKPGSILVTTNLPGVYVRIDQGNENSQADITPFIFENIAPGEHTLEFDDRLIDDKALYLGGEALSVSVFPGKQAVVTKSLVRGEAVLRLTDFPDDCVVTLDGEPIDSLSVFGSGYHFNAGRYLLEVSAPTTQKWKTNFVIKGKNYLTRDSPLFNAKGSYLFNNSLARRTVKIDGMSDDWNGLLPLWSKEDQNDPFKTQTGTKMSDIYVCRDDKYLYWQIYFSDGNPTAKLTSDISRSLSYELRIFRPSSQDSINLDIILDRGSGSKTSAGIYSNTYKKWTNIADNRITYKFSEGVLEAMIPLSILGKKLPEGILQTTFIIANADSNGKWLGSTSSDFVNIDYYE